LSVCLRENGGLYSRYILAIDRHHGQSWKLRSTDTYSSPACRLVQAYYGDSFRLQQIQLLAHRDRHGLAMQANTRTLVNGNAVTGLLRWLITAESFAASASPRNWGELGSAGP
jgi:hypothetical protein